MSRLLTHTAARITIASIGALSIAMLGGCEAGPKQTAQWGYRGTGMNQIVAVKNIVHATIPDAPYPLPADGGPTAAQTYQNVKVLGGISAERFNHLMAEINQWVAPTEQGCAYCHNPANMASDEKYTKIVARRMIQMTQTINSQWSPHVKVTGVTCYTCHRGNGVPANKWAMEAGPANPNSPLGNRNYHNQLSADAAYSDLPTSAFGDYLAGAQNIRVNGTMALPSGDGAGASVQNAEKTYSLMMHMSKALNVNCTFCHNGQAFAAWNLSRPQRATAWYGIRMVRDINNNYITSLTSVFPAYRKGPLGDPYKVNCTTCHQGQNKPLGGVSMIAQAPALMGPLLPAASAAPEPAAAAVSKPLAMNAPRAMTGRK